MSSENINIKELVRNVDISLHGHKFKGEAVNLPDTVIEGDLFVSGKLDVIGGIDPFYLQLDPVNTPADSKLDGLNNILFVDSNDSYKLFLRDNSGSVKELAISVAGLDETGTPSTTWQIDNDATGPVLKNVSGDLVIRTDGDAGYGGITTEKSILSPRASAGLANNTMFVDSGDSNLLKWKDNAGALKTVALGIAFDPTADETISGHWTFSTNPTISATRSNSFTLDSDNVGAGVDQYIYFNRGSTGSDSYLKWDETADSFDLFDGTGLAGLNVGSITTDNLNVNGTQITLDADNTGAGANSQLKFNRGTDVTGDAALLWSAANTRFSLFSDLDGTNALAQLYLEEVRVNGLTANRALTTNASKILASSATTDTELGYVSGVTSAIQTQLDGKALDTGSTGGFTVGGDLDINGGTITLDADNIGAEVASSFRFNRGSTVTGDAAILWSTTNGRFQLYSDLGGAGTLSDLLVKGLQVNDLTANRALITDASKNLASSVTTNTELGFLTGTISNVQNQIDSKADANHYQYVTFTWSGEIPTGSGGVDWFPKRMWMRQAVTVRQIGWLTQVSTTNFRVNVYRAGSLFYSTAAQGASLAAMFTGLDLSFAIGTMTCEIEQNDNSGDYNATVIVAYTVD